MVSGVNSGGVSGLTQGAASLANAQARQKPTLTLLNAQSGEHGDQVRLGEAALWTAARQSVVEGLSQLDKAIAAGESVQRTLLDLQDAARAYGEDPSIGREKIDSLMKDLAEAAGKAEAAGVRLVRGGAISIAAEPGGAPINLQGLDLQVRAAPGEADTIQVAAELDLSDGGAALLQSAKTSFDRVRTQLGRLEEARSALTTHRGFLGAAENALGVANDLDADGARLLALQVKQGLEQAGAQSIVNVEPQAVLALFRS